MIQRNATAVTASLNAVFFHPMHHFAQRKYTGQPKNENTDDNGADLSFAGTA